MIMPIMIPVGVKKVNMVKSTAIWQVVNPVLASAVPRAMLAVASCTIMPAPSYHAVSISLSRPNAMPSNTAWNPIAIVNMMAVFLDTVAVGFFETSSVGFLDSSYYWGVSTTVLPSLSVLVSDSKSLALWIWYLDVISLSIIMITKYPTKVIT